MLEIGWTELLVIAVVLIVVVGPKDLPPMLRAFGKMTTRLRTMAGDFRSQFDEALREADLDEVRRTIDDARKLNPVTTLMEAVNPLRQAGEEIKAELQSATTFEKKTDATSAVETPLSVPEPVVTLPDTPPAVAVPTAGAAAAATPVAPPQTAVAEAVSKPVRKPRVKAESEVNDVATASVAKVKSDVASDAFVASAAKPKTAKVVSAKTAAPKATSAKTAATKTAATDKKKDKA